MKKRKNTGKILVDYYEAEKQSLVARMKSRDKEQVNLIIKIATFAIYELSHSTPFWFKSHFLANISKDNDTDIISDNKILRAESAFFNSIADYLIAMESEIDYVNGILTPLAEEWQKKDFWRPIVLDAFLLVGIYFTSLPEFMKNDTMETEKSGEARNRRNHHSLFLQQALYGNSGIA